MFTIQSVKARQILDSRGNPTVETVLSLRNKTHNKKTNQMNNSSQIYSAVASVPSGASTGKHEAVELRDNDSTRYNGKSVGKAIFHVNNQIGQKIKNKQFTQQSLDHYLNQLDGTVNKEKLGANAILSVSLAFAKATALAQKKPLYASLYSGSKSLVSKKYGLPTPYMNIINGGKHAANSLAIQEFMIVPMMKSGNYNANQKKANRSYAESVRIGVETYHHLRELIIQKYGKSSANIGDEGGFVLAIKKTEEVLQLLTKAIDTLGYEKQIKIAIDCAASEFYHKGYYYIDGYKVNREQLLYYYETMVNHYPIVSIEDPFAEDDFLGFQEITAQLGKKKKIQIVGDDLLVTNPLRIKMAIERKLCNALLLKVNQIGTVTEALESAALAKKAGWNVMVSHRSGETNDSFIADLAVALNCGQIKAGAPCRGERVAKYNRLLEIEEELG